MDRLRRPSAIVGPNFADVALTKYQRLRANPLSQTLLLGLIASEADGPVSRFLVPGGRYRIAVATGCGLFRSMLRSGGQAGHAGAADGLPIVSPFVNTSFQINKVDLLPPIFHADSANSDSSVTWNLELNF